jgi:colanic acid/amylovoran biosynthesis glycosyltransferase
MRIAYLIGEFPKPSETFVWREVVGLRELGFRIQIFSFKRPTREESASLDRAIRHFPGVHYINPLEIVMGAVDAFIRDTKEKVAQLNKTLSRVVTMAPNPYLRLWRAYAIARLLRRQRVDFIYAHWPYASQIAVLVHAITDIPYGISVHAHEVAHDNGHFPLLFQTVTFASFCNQAAMEYLLSHLPPVCRERSFLVRHGVDLEQFSQKPFTTMPPPLKILSVGRLTRTKGFDRLIQGCARAIREGLDIELVILGVGSQLEKLAKQAEELGIAGKVKLPGWVPHSEVPRWLADCHIFALLADTSYHDGLPNVVLEAMASGRPVILSSLPAAGEAVTDGVEGFILRSPDDLEGFLVSLRRLMRTPGLLTEMGANARRRIERDHDARIHLKVLANLFEKACKSGMER